MNEITLLIVSISLLLIPPFILRTAKNRLSGYIKMASALLLLLLVWIFDNEGKLPVKVILSSIAMTTLFREYLSVKKISN